VCLGESTSYDQQKTVLRSLQTNSTYLFDENGDKLPRMIIGVICQQVSLTLPVFSIQTFCVMRNSNKQAYCELI
jgi:hypothetical protein